MQQNYEDEFRNPISGARLPNSNHAQHVSSEACVAQCDYAPIKHGISNIKKCSNYPYFQDTINICNGYRPVLCKNLILGHITLLSKNELAKNIRTREKNMKDF